MKSTSGCLILSNEYSIRSPTCFSTASTRACFVGLSGFGYFALVLFFGFVSSMLASDSIDTSLGFNVAFSGSKLVSESLTTLRGFFFDFVLVSICFVSSSSTYGLTSGSYLTGISLLSELTSFTFVIYFTVSTLVSSSLTFSETFDLDFRSTFFPFWDTCLGLISCLTSLVSISLLRFRFLLVFIFSRNLQNN